MLGKRLKHVREKLGLTQKEFANRIGVSLITLQRYEKGEREPTSDVLAKIKESFNLNINWLLTGEGEMFLKKEKNTPIEEQILQVISNEPEEKKKALLEFLKNAWASQTLSNLEEQSGKNF